MRARPGAGYPFVPERNGGLPRRDPGRPHVRPGESGQGRRARQDERELNTVLTELESARRKAETAPIQSELDRLRADLTIMQANLAKAAEERARMLRAFRKTP